MWFCGTAHFQPHSIKRVHRRESFETNFLVFFLECEISQERGTEKISLLPFLKCATSAVLPDG